MSVLRFIFIFLTVRFKVSFPSLHYHSLLFFSEIYRERYRERERDKTRRALTESFREPPLRDCHLVLPERDVVRARVSQHVVECLVLRDVLGGAPNDDDELNFVVWEVERGGLRCARDRDGR